MRILKFPKLGLLQLWKLITLCENLQLRWGLKQSCIPCWEFSNDMWHITHTQWNWGDSWLLVVGNQIGNLIPSLSFDHNFCFKYSNGSCKPILDIYVLRDEKLFNQMGFDPCNCFLKILGLQLPKWEFIWEWQGSFSHTLLHSQEHEMWLPGSLLAHTFTSPYLGRKPKVKVATSSFLQPTLHWCCKYLGLYLLCLPMLF